jgi:alkanesulfonate monooxygenase SsuD/methylene tetrahydromethanopterin reductase-like flavin-dependent oxidoreductase (luciferase family)
MQEVIDDYYPGYAEVFTKIGKERGWPPVRRENFDAQMSPAGSMLIGNPEEVAAKILRHSEALGGISRVTFQMDNAGLAHEKLMQSIELIGKRVAPMIRGLN